MRLAHVICESFRVCVRDIYLFIENSNGTREVLSKRQRLSGFHFGKTTMTVAQRINWKVYSGEGIGQSRDFSFSLGGR